MTTPELCWVAGLLEGEGYFGDYGGTGRNVRVVVAMNDLDVVERLRLLIHPAGRIWLRRPRRPTHSVSYTVGLPTRKAVGLMMTLYPLLGERRRRRIREILTCWRRVPCKLPAAARKCRSCERWITGARACPRRCLRPFRLPQRQLQLATA